MPTYDAIKEFQWGREAVTNNKVKGSSCMSCTNSNAIFNANILNNGFIQDATPNAPVDITGISENVIEKGGNLTLSQTFGQVYANLINGGTILATSIALNGFVLKNVVENSDVLANGGVVSGEISYNVVIGSSRLDILGNIDGELRHNNLSRGGNVRLTSIGFSSGFTENDVSSNAIQFPAIVTPVYIDKKASRIGYCDFETILDLSDPSMYDLSTKTLNIPSAFTGFGVYYLLNSTGKIIEKITGYSGFTFDLTFLPVAGESVGFQHTLVASSFPHDLLCDAPAWLNTITGRTNGTDYMQYKKSGDRLIRSNLVLLA